MTSAGDASDAELPFRLVVLVGFMASGKSTVGALLARRLGWVFVDLDTEIETRAGATIPEIFQRAGEERFRDLEVEAGDVALAGRCSVVASGGGWPVAPGRMEGLAVDVLTVWLQVTPEVAVVRAGRDNEVRPLLNVHEPVARARELLEARAGSYAKARLHLDTVGVTAEDTVESILRHAAGRLPVDIMEAEQDPRVPDRGSRMEIEESNHT